MYQDTDFGKEILVGAELQTKKLGVKLVETAAHKPTDQDFTASITKLRSAGCDLIAMGTIVRDSIVPYTTARKAGWTDVDFLGSAAVYDLVVGAAPGMEGFYGMGLTEMPYVDSHVASVKTFVEAYKKKFNIDPNIGAVYGYLQRPRGQFRPQHPAGRELLVPRRGEGRPLDPRHRSAGLLAASHKPPPVRRGRDRK
jgi:branched-chain amino acid transport system substrate-binding protein